MPRQPEPAHHRLAAHPLDVLDRVVVEAAGQLDPDRGCLDPLQHRGPRSVVGPDLGDDLLEGQLFSGREVAESDLTQALQIALTAPVVDQLRDDPGLAGGPALARVRAAALRVQLARRFHNDATREVRRVRAKRSVKFFRLAGYAILPEPVSFDDELPSALAA